MPRTLSKIILVSKVLIKSVIKSVDKKCFYVIYIILILLCLLNFWGLFGERDMGRDSDIGMQPGFAQNVSGCMGWEGWGRGVW